MLTPDEIRHFKDRLESEREAIRSRMAARSRDSRQTVRDESGVGDSADQSIRLEDLDIEADQEAIDRATLARVERALRRIENGAYGVSEYSGKPIPKERLEAVPYAATLVNEPTLEPD